MTKFENIIYVSIETGDDAYRGVVTEPLKTIKAGIDKAAGYIADGLAETVDVYVAEGLYEVNSSAESGGIMLSNKVSLYGGYKQDFTERDFDAYVSEIVDNAESGDFVATVKSDESVTESCRIDGFTIRGGDTNTTDGWTAVIHSESSDISIINNKIYAGTSPVTGISAGIYVTDGGTSYIEDNYIHGGTSTGYCVAVVATLNAITNIAENVIDSGTGGNTTGVLAQNVSAEITDNRIIAGSGVLTEGLKITDSSQTIVKANYIYGGDATEWARGIYLSSDGVTIERNKITGGTSTARLDGIYCYEHEWTIIRNNLVFGGDSSSPDYDANAVFLNGPYAKLYNNTLAGGTSIHSSAVCMRIGSKPDIKNNILFAFGTVSSNCILEDGTNAENAGSINNNTLWDYDGNTLLYHTYDNNDYDSYTTVNVLGYASGNVGDIPIFVDLDGPDDDITTMEDNDWRLTTSAPDDIRQGGLDGIVQGWGFETDIDGNTRTNLTDGPNDSPTNADAAGWSMGAYEKD